MDFFNVDNPKYIVSDPGVCELGKMFQLQSNLMDKYIGLGKLPNYPLPSLDDRGSQLVIRDLIGYLLEELGEAYEKINETTQNILSPMGREITSKNVVQVNEEMADILHFLLEIMVFSGITRDDLATETYKGLVEMNIGDKYMAQYKENPSNMQVLHAMLLLGSTICRMNRKNPIGNVAVLHNHNIIDIELGFNFTSPKGLEVIALICWDITQNMTMVTNTLKNKPWKQGDMETKTDKYNERLYYLFFSVIELYSYMGFTAEAVYQTYALKNHINLVRVLQKY